MSEGAATNPPSAFHRPSSDGRRVLGNFLSLSLVQFANYLAPLITLPYLFRVLGLEKYGLTELARAISVYFLILTDYGFSFSATQEISVHRDDPGKVSEVFSAVLLLKFLLLVLSFALLSLVVLVVPKLRADWPVYYLSFGNVVGMWLFPIWLFQGLERMKYIPMLSVTAKTLYIIAIFSLIRGPADYLYVPLFQSASAILTGLAGLIMALRCFPIRLRRPSVAVLRQEFRNGWHLFVSQMATTLYSTSNIVILGLLTNTTFVAYYAAGDKIVRAVRGLQLPLSQAIFPHIGRVASQSRRAALAYSTKVGLLVGLVTLTMSAGLFFAAPAIARAVLSESQFQGGASVLRILSPLPFLVGISDVLGLQIMVNFGLAKHMARILVAGGVLNIMIAVLLVMPLKHVGVALASLTTEIFIVAALCLALWLKRRCVFGEAAAESSVYVREQWQ